MQAVILAAGKGTRMRSARPKVLQEMFGRPMLTYVLWTLKKLGVQKPNIVIGSGADQVRSFLEDNKKELGITPKLVLQKVQKGTGHAVQMCSKTLGTSRDDLLIWPGDMPLLKLETIREFVKQHKKSKAEVSVLSSVMSDPTSYGRILRAGGKFYAIREELEATEAERRVQEVNTGVYLFKTKSLFRALKKIKPSSVKKELYLTDTLEILAQENKKIEAFPLAMSEEALGVNNRTDLAEAVSKMRSREVQKHLNNGVSFVDPDQTYVEPNVKIGSDSMIYPWCYIESGVSIGSRCKIGPFAKIRKGTKIEDGATIGSFVEVARSKVGKNAQAKHLAYLGDAVIGEGSNIGAGTITANYDGKNKNQTKLGKKVLVGSNTVLVAPVSLGDGVKTGAGSVVTAGSKIKKGEIVAGVPARPIRKKKKSKRK